MKGTKPPINIIRNSQNKNMKIRKTISIVAVIIIFIVFEYYNTFDAMENMLRDYNYTEDNYVDSRIIIIGIDDESLEAIGKWPWERSIHSQLIEIVESGNPAVVGVDIMFTERDNNVLSDNKMINVLKKYDNIVFPVTGIFTSSLKADEVKASKLLAPIDEYKENVVTGHINVLPDTDGIVRNSLVHFTYNDEEIYSFSWNIYKMFMEKQNNSNILKTIPLDSWNRMHISYHSKPFEIEYISYSKVLEGKIPLGYFKNKILLIGSYTLGIDDYYLTPIEKQVPMYGIEIHANIIQNLLSGSIKSIAPIYYDFFILLLICAISMIFLNKMGLVKSLGSMSLLAISYYLISKQLYRSGIILYLFYPLLFLLVINALLSLFNYIEEIKEKKYIRDMFGRYVSDQVVDEILEKNKNEIKLGGIRKEATFIFIDIRNFTVLSEKLSSENVVEILNSYLNIFANSILENGGTLDKFIGDAAMGIFNAPLELENHPLKAVMAAMQMINESKTLQIEILEKYGENIGFGIGINTGQAIIGNIGSEFRMDYTAIGDAVNTASRLEGVANANQILISENVFKHINSDIETTSLGSIKVKGKDIPIKTYEVKGVKKYEK